MRCFASGVMALSLWLALAPRASAQEPDVETVAAAKREGKVVFYAGFPSNALQAATVKSFQEKYGITVDLLAVRASEINERIRAEHASGRQIGDVMQHGESATILHTAAGLVQKMGALPNRANLLPALAPNDYQVTGFVAPYALMVNTNLVKPGDEPKSWADLADAKWRGKILADDPRAIGGGATFFTITEQLYGDAYHEKLRDNGIVFTRDVGSGERRVAVGEYAIWTPVISSSMPNLAGLPLKLVTPTEGVLSVRMDLSVLDHAPHPNAARLFINHFLSSEFQAQIAGVSLLPSVRGLDERLPENLRPLAKAKWLGSMTAENQQRMLDLATRIYK